ncbi:TlpA family protein disulfide reductase [Wenjunlia tyrosinilytica]|jgi:peroxiredoxin|uniref:Thioredoxin domain-containing protein n=1 Tax=Wenjunlia tyrosinilytica TaxID=1544741 RepID=A0A917ZTD9_9ACTN|nr:TlpA disulfide reductase family protein [Wenjunlia tyrosinilytica]GGO89731.1 hypothetical protein GCM10012280_33650 [Wenjunlia tyrosinilytica]
MSLTRAPRRPLRRTAALAGAAVLASFALAACSSGQNAGGPSDGQGFVGGKKDARINQYPAKDRKSAPDITGKSLDGKPIKLSDYRGEILVLNVWGSWCSPCRAEAKYLRDVAGQTQDKGVRFLGVNVRDPDPANARAFERNHRMPYPSIYDPSSRQLVRFGSAVPVTIPTTLVIDRDGKIAARAIMPVSDENLHTMIDPLVAEKR